MGRSTFSGAFETGALTELPKSSIIFNVFINIAEYLFFTIICYYIAYPPQTVTRLLNIYIADSKVGSHLPIVLRRAITIKRMPRELVIAVCLCGAAKTTSVGIPLAAAMWSKQDNFTISSIQVPVLLYTVEQVFVAQFLTIFFKWWLQRSNKEASDEESLSTCDINGHGQGPVSDCISPGSKGDRNTSVDEKRCEARVAGDMDLTR
jgi:sodium/bile acid cotransporter 7